MTSPAATRTAVHAAQVVVPVAGPPIPSGAVAVDLDTGRITSVGTRDQVIGETLTAHPSAWGTDSVTDSVTEWDGVLTPGLVNAHTHLQYTAFAPLGVDTYSRYSAWADRFIAEYDVREGEEDWGKAARAGAELALASGTTCFADVVTDLGALSALADLELPGISYWELIGIDAVAWESEVEAATLETLQGARAATDGAAARIGLSPHAPYSLEPEVLSGAAALARRLGVRLHVHLAEIDGEDAYYRTGTGAWAERVARRVGRPWGILATGGTGMGAGGYARSRDLLGPDCHVAHGVYLDAEDRALLRRAGTAVALCPRSNLALGVDPPPVAAYLEEGSPVAVGTDSLASSPSLDLLEDVAVLRRLAVEGGDRGDDLDRRLLRAATLGGAEALGLTGEVGSLEVGKRADFAVFAVDPDRGHDQDADRGQVERTLVEHGAGTCAATVVGGALRWTRSAAA